MEDGPVVVAVLNEEFEILHVDRGFIWIEFNGDRSAVGTVVPRQLKLNDIGGGPGLVRDVDHRQHQDASKENRHHAGRGRCAVVEQAGEGGLADALVLHLVEQVVVEAVGFLVPWILFGGFSQERSRFPILCAIVASLGLEPGGMACQPERGWLLSIKIHVPKNLEG